MKKNSQKAQAVSTFEEAEKAYRKLLSANPENSDIYHQLGILYYRQGRSRKAVSFFRRAVELKPDSPEILSNLGLAQMNLGNCGEAITCYENSLRLRPDIPEIINSLANAYAGNGDLQKAEKLFEKLILLKNDYPEAYYNFACLCMKSGNCSRAIPLYERAISLKPGYFSAYNNMGNALAELKEHEKALSAFRRAVGIKNDFYEAYLNMGNLLLAMNNVNEALEAYKKAVEIHPASAEARLNIANAYRNKLDIGNAISSFNTALRLSPDNAETHLNLALTLLLDGKMREGWAEYEWRLKTPGFSHLNLPFPGWNGQSSPAARILAVAEQGFGDTIQFFRYLPFVRERCGELIFLCQPPLVPLLEKQNFADKIISSDTNCRQGPAFDFYIPLLSLPLALDIAIPDRIPYIKADPEKVSRWKECLKKFHRLKVGLCRAGSHSNTNDRLRSIPLVHLKPLLDIGGMDFFSLRKGASSKSVSGHENLIDFTEDFRDFSDTAAFIENMDIVISADTVIAHLSAAMNKETWLLLTFASEWRWLLQRNDSPWYPCSMKIFRQTAYDDWPSAIFPAAEKLKERG